MKVHRIIPLFLATALCAPLLADVKIIRKQRTPASSELAGEYNGSSSEKSNLATAAITGYGTSVISCVEPDVATGDHGIFMITRDTGGNHYLGVEQRSGTSLRVFAAGTDGFDSVVRASVFAADTKVCVAAIWTSATSFRACSSNGTPGCTSGTVAPGTISALAETRIGVFNSAAVPNAQFFDGEMKLHCVFTSAIADNDFLVTFLGGGQNKAACQSLGADFIWDAASGTNEGDGGAFALTVIEVGSVPW